MKLRACMRGLALTLLLAGAAIVAMAAPQSTREVDATPVVTALTPPLATLPIELTMNYNSPQLRADGKALLLFSPTLASGATGITVSAIDASDGHLLEQTAWPGVSGHVASYVAGKALVVDRQTLWLVDAQTGKVLQTGNLGTETILTGQLSSDASTLVLTGKGDEQVRTINVIDVGTWKQKDITDDVMPNVMSMDISPDGKLLAVGGAQLELWQIDGLQRRHVLAGHTGPVTKVSFSPDGRWLLSAGLDRTLRIWDAQTGEHLRCLGGQTSDIGGTTFSRDGRFVLSIPGRYLSLASDTRDERMYLWDVRGDARFDLARPAMATIGPAITPDGHILMLGGYTMYRTDASRIFGKPAAAPNLEARAAEHASVGLVGVLPAGAQGAVWGKVEQSQQVFYLSSGTVARWDPSTGTPKELASGISADGTSMDIAPACGLVLWAQETGPIHVQDWNKPGSVATLGGNDDGVLGPGFSSDGRGVVAAYRDGTAGLWDTATGKLICEMSQDGMEIDRAACSADGAIVATAAVSHWSLGHRATRPVIVMWNGKTGKQTGALPAVTAPPAPGNGPAAIYPRALALSADGARVLVCDDNGVLVRDTQTGEVILHHDGLVACADISRDGERILTGELQSTHGVGATAQWNLVQLWDVKTGDLLASFGYHTDSIFTVRFSPDGRYALSSSRDQTTRVYRLP